MQPLSSQEKLGTNGGTLILTSLIITGVSAFYFTKFVINTIASK